MDSTFHNSKGKDQPAYWHNPARALPFREILEYSVYGLSTARVVSAPHSKAVPLLQIFFVCRLLELCRSVLSLFVIIA